MVSRWVSAECWARLEYSSEACAICLVRASSSERARSSIRGATRISASRASRARMPRSFLSFALLRLKVTRDIQCPLPDIRVAGRVQEAFPEFGKIGANPVNPRPGDDMAAETILPTTPGLPGGLAAVEQEIARACKDARRERAAGTLIAVSKT